MPAKELRREMAEMKDACLKHREECSASVCRKMSKIEIDIAAIKDGNASYQEEMQKTLIKISNHMGRTTEFMENSKLNRPQIGGG